MVAPQIPEYSNPGNIFLSAFLRAQQNRRQQMELDQKIQQQTLMNALKEKQLEINQSLGEQKIQNAASLLDLNKEKTSQTMNDVIEMVGKIRKIKAQPGTYDYAQELNNVETQHPLAAGSVYGNRIVAPLRQQSDMIFNKQQKLFDGKIKQLGIPYDAFENPQNWQSREDGKRFIHVPLPDEAANPKDYESVGSNPPTKNKNFVTIDDKTYQTLQGQYKSLMGDIPSTGLHNAKFNSEMLREAQIAREKAADSNFNPEAIRNHFKQKYQVELDDVK